MSAVSHMFYGSFETYNSTVAFIYAFDQSWGQGQVQVGTNFAKFWKLVFSSNIGMYLTNVCLYCPVLTQHAKHYLFWCTPIRNPRKSHVTSTAFFVVIADALLFDDSVIPSHFPFSLVSQQGFPF